MRYPAVALPLAMLVGCMVCGREEGTLARPAGGSDRVVRDAAAGPVTAPRRIVCGDIRSPEGAVLFGLGALADLALFGDYHGRSHYDGCGTLVRRSP